MSDDPQSPASDFHYTTALDTTASSDNPPPSFPTHLTPLHFRDPLTTPTLYTTLRFLRRSTLSLHSRLASILHDAAYIAHTVHTAFPTLPLLANERCGSWYILPPLRVGSAYFKSTDGHHGQWDFSLRRLNLQVLEVLGSGGGAVLVDSTRRGKRMPDALRRTVPVWVCVWMRVLFPECEGGELWRLQHPGLEPGEVAAIEGRVPAWVEGLKGLGLNWEGIRRKVRRPVRLRWVVHGEEMQESEDGDEDCNLLVLCSASRRVLGAEMSEDGYVQGAADDAEGWSGGLTSALFWEHKDELTAVPEEDLPDLIERLVRDSRLRGGAIEAVQIKPTRNVFVAALPSGGDDADLTAREFDFIVDCNRATTADIPKTLSLGCRSAKLGSRELREKLSLVHARILEALKKDEDSKVLVVCENGKDLSIGVAVMLLCLLYDDEGQVDITRSVVVDKQLVKKRLAWITSRKPDANPSRSTLQAVNSFLMERPP